MPHNLQNLDGLAAAIDRASGQYRTALQASVLGHQESLEELWELWNECHTADWDGYGAMAVEQATYTSAYVLIGSLPLGFPRPSLGAEPDGQLTLEWRKSATRLLSVSVDPDGLLHYAGLYGSSKRYGTIEYFSTPPEELLRLVQDL